MRRASPLTGMDTDGTAHSGLRSESVDIVRERPGRAGRDERVGDEDAKMPVDEVGIGVG